MNITDYFPDYIEVGYTKKTYGVKGQLRVHVENTYLSSIAAAKHVFFLLKGCLVPYFIEDFEGGVVKFESCTNPEEAKKIVAKTIYLQKDQIKTFDSSPQEDSFTMVRGFELYNSANEELIGIVDDVVSYPQQEIAILGDIMIPLNFDNVKGIDMEARVLYVDIPDGLLDVNS